MEIFNNVPLLLIFPFADIQDFWFRFFFMTDTSRVYFMFRIYQLIENDIYREILIILNNSVFLVLFSSGFLTLVENEKNFPEIVVVNNFHNTAFFVMTSISIIGYGSVVSTISGKLYLIGLLTIVMVAIPK